MLTNHPRIRLALYLASLVAAIASAFTAALFPPLSVPFATTSALLVAAATGSALANFSGYPSSSAQTPNDHRAL